VLITSEVIPVQAYSKKPANLSESDWIIQVRLEIGAYQGESMKAQPSDTLPIAAIHVG
jgi:hypothetical protein